MAKRVVTRSTNIERNSAVVRQIDGNTQIIFNVKNFIALLGSLLTLFFGFYLVVIVPKINKSDEQYKMMFTEQKDQNVIFYQELGKINTSIGSLGATINALNEREIKNNTNTTSNTGGSFGGGIGGRNTTANGGR